MTSERRAAAALRLWLRVAATIVAWVLAIVYIHRLAHMYQSDIAEVLNFPLLQIFATTVLITVLVYLVSLSLPFVPNLRPRTIGIVFLWAAFLVAGHSLSHMGFHDAQVMLNSMQDVVGPLTLVLLAIAYALALAIPFVPGVELGLLIMAVFGPKGALVAYAATIGGLSMAHAIGRMLPEQVIVGMLKRFGIVVPEHGAASAMQGMLSESRLGRTAASRLGALVLDYRYVTLALCLNLPGNSVAGGGGGLALLCGLSRQFRWRSFLLTVAVATSPVPILVFVGWLNLEPFMEHHGSIHDVLTRIQRLFIHD